MAIELGMTVSKYRQYEAGNITFTILALERIAETTGFDPYMLAYVLYRDHSKYPRTIQAKLTELRDEWEKQLEIMRRIKHRLPNSWW